MPLWPLWYCSAACLVLVHLRKGNLTARGITFSTPFQCWNTSRGIRVSEKDLSVHKSRCTLKPTNMFTIVNLAKSIDTVPLSSSKPFSCISCSPVLHCALLRSPQIPCLPPPVSATPLALPIGWSESIGPLKLPLYPQHPSTSHLIWVS